MGSGEGNESPRFWHFQSASGRALDGAALPRAVEHLQLRHDDLLDQDVGLGGQGVAVVVLLEDLDARPVDQEGVVEDEKVVVEHAERVALQARSS